jgi:two-component system sensor histidine kinase ChvG
VSLTARILAVNVIVLALMAFSLLFSTTIATRCWPNASSAPASRPRSPPPSAPVGSARPRCWPSACISRCGCAALCARRHLAADSFALAPPSFSLADPRSQPWTMKAARTLDRMMDAALLAPPVPRLCRRTRQPEGCGGLWPEVMEARAQEGSTVRERYAPDRTPIINAATPLGARRHAADHPPGARCDPGGARRAQTLAMWWPRC